MAEDTPERTAGEPWASPYAVVPLVAGALAVGLAAIDPTRVAMGPAWPVGGALAAAGTGLVVWTVLTVRRASETLSPVATPARLVTGGPLAHTRNPMYLGVVTTVAGVALVAGSPAAGGYALALLVVYHVVVVRVEEPKLQATFGETYEDYRRRVPRWLPLGRHRPPG